MKRSYNTQAFTPEEVKKGLAQDLLNYLLDYNKKNTEQYYDIHITSDGYCTIIEWVDVMYTSKYGEDGKFQFVDYDEYVMKEFTFPDNHTEMCYSEEDAEQRLQEWLKDNPSWVKNEWGCWTNELENERARKMLEDSCPCDYCKDDANNPTKDCSTCPYNHEDMDGDVCSECEDDEIIPSPPPLEENSKLFKYAK